MTARTMCWKVLLPKKSSSFSCIVFHRSFFTLDEYNERLVNFNYGNDRPVPVLGTIFPCLEPYQS